MAWLRSPRGALATSTPTSTNWATASATWWPPQVSSLSREPLTIGFEEIASDKIIWTASAPPADESDVLAEAADAAADDNA